MEKLKCKRNFELRKLKFHEDMSEETPCFSAELYEDGKLLAYVSNRGNGGCNDYHPAKGKTYKDIQDLTQIDIDCHIMGLAEELNTIKKYQSKALVLEKDGQIFTQGFKHSIAQYKKAWDAEKYKRIIGAEVKKAEAEGFRVLNTNLGL